ncbi:sodium:solute symporter family protein [uncultured Draconibacterium sp.]|uniref:sodium:solute symporter family protein n=1 Tax=uncultured Draconibacterium sp. TaxID=1573823 RepID=UPI0025DDCC77|nr:sodium:solute symporter family protein [uncultured Draconibacterium sp.]
MGWIDLSIFCIYLTAMLGVGVYFLRKNKNTDDYFVGGRKLSSIHIGLSVVATDVGGGFSIGLGGLGFTMGLSGSWLLFTGLLGAWLSAVLLIPKVAGLARRKGFLSFPQFLEFIFDKRVALIAGLISAIGYLGFTSSQILAGAKLAASTFNGLSLNNALLIMGTIAVVYTVLGGLKAVIYTDTIQWIILMIGLIFIGLPFAYYEIGGYNAIVNTLEPDFLSLRAISWQQIVNWMFTIIPIWFIGMTLYQRIYASKNTQTAQRGWFIAGLFEYPLMAFIGVMLGMFARVAMENQLLPGYNATNLDAEMGLPVLLKTVLPVGFLGIVLSAYFSAIMSTADSCLMAASGNLLTDVFRMHNRTNSLRLSQVLTLIIGTIALLLALKMTSVLELMLHSYSFMVSGMIIPVLAALFAKRPNKIAALFSMLTGGSVTLLLILLRVPLPLNLDANIFGISASLIIYLLVASLSKTKQISI